MTQLGAGIIGLGVGEQHIAGYRRPPLCDVAALCDLSEDRLRCVASKHPHCKQTTRWRELLEDPDVHVVSIASFDDAHCQQTVTALRAGKHCFVEKPLCCSLAELKQIKAAHRQSARSYLASNLVLRAAPIYRWLREAIQSGQLGEIYAFDGEYLYGRIHKITEGWRKDVANYSVMQGGGVHLIDLMLWLTGQKPTSVWAIGNRICTRASDFRYDDFTAATFQFDGGMIGRITANFGCVHPHQHVVRVFGTQATFVLDDQGPRLFSHRDARRGSKKLELATLPSAKSALIPDFVDAILNNSDRDVSAQREFDTMLVCLAADEAIRAGRTIGIEYV